MRFVIILALFLPSIVGVRFYKIRNTEANHSGPNYYEMSARCTLRAFKAGATAYLVSNTGGCRILKKEEIFHFPDEDPKSTFYLQLTEEDEAIFKELTAQQKRNLILDYFRRPRQRHPVDGTCKRFLKQINALTKPGDKTAEVYEWTILAHFGVPGDYHCLVFTKNDAKLKALTYDDTFALPLAKEANRVGIDTYHPFFEKQAHFDYFVEAAKDIQIAGPFWVGNCNDGSGARWTRNGKPNTLDSYLASGSFPEKGECSLLSLKPEVKWTKSDKLTKAALNGVSFFLPV